MIFIDSNIPMYLIGTAYPHKTQAQIILARRIAAGKRLVTDAEVLREILHRYTAINKRDAIGPALQVTLDIVNEEMPALLSARDAVHIAIMERHIIRSIFSFDADFDRWAGLQRIHRI